MIDAFKFIFAEHPWLITLSLCGGVPAWLGMMKFLARKSGWTELARRFRSQGESPGKRPTLGSVGSSREVDYNGGIKIGVSDSALNLSCLLLMRAFHPPLAIPWSQIDDIVAPTMQEDRGGVRLSNTDLILYFDEIQLAEIRGAWERHRRAGETVLR